MTEVAKLVTEIVADTSKFRSEINSSKAEVGSFVSTIKAGSVVAVAALTAIAGAATLLTKEIFESADRISKLADNATKIGVTVAAFQELSVAAREAGVSADSLQTLIANMNKRLGEAQLGGGQAAKALQALGISFAELKSLSPDQQFALISSKLKELKDVQLETAIASDLFGKSAKDGIGLFNSNIDSTIDKVKSLGITLTESQKDGLDKLSETKDLIGTIWEGFKDNVAAEVAPAFQQMLDGIVNAVQGMGGLKEAAKTTADFIVGAMQNMQIAINFAVQAMQAAKAVYDGISNSFIGGLLGQAKDLLGLYIRAITYPARTAISALSGQPRIGDGTVRAKSADTSNFTQQEATSKIQSIQMTNTASQVMATYNNQTKDTTDALKQMKEEAQRTASVLDSFHAIKDALQEPGKQQTSDIIKQATGGLGDNLAISSQFQEVFTKAIKDTQAGDTSNIKTSIQQLQNIINEQKGAHWENNGGANPEDFATWNQGRDVSGLVGALNELKSFLAQKSSPKDQQVEVKIKVDASDNFVTNITTSQTFKQAVDQEFDDRTAAAARGNIP